jgi:diguanylate cyclase (GGDEF)-like protein
MALLGMRHQAERQRADAEHQRVLAEAEAARARELEVSLAVLENLSRIGREIIANLDLSNVLNALVAHLGKLLLVDYVGISVLESNGKLMIRRAIENGIPLPERRVSLDDPNSLVARCARERRELLSEQELGKRPPTHIPGTQIMHTAWFGPLLVGEELVGALTIQSSNENAYGAREQLILRTLSAYVAVAVANARAYTRLGEQHARLTLVEAEMRRLATTDALTNIPNRRQFLAALSNETRRTRRNGRPMAVVMGDIDYFKRVNDTLGHAAGDVVLMRVARVLNDNKRAIDTVGRLGGEEFALLLPETELEQAVEVADRLRAQVAAELINWEGGTIPVTISFGCAVLDATLPGSESAQIEQLLKTADHALYRAKDAGRNRTAWSRGNEGGIIEPLPTAQ